MPRNKNSKSAGMRRAARALRAFKNGNRVSDLDLTHSIRTLGDVMVFLQELGERMSLPWDYLRVAQYGLERERRRRRESQTRDSGAGSGIVGITEPAGRGAARSPGSERTQAPHVVNGRGTAKLLVVDENTDEADPLADALRKQGYLVRTAYSYRQCLKLIDEYRPDIVLDFLPNADLRHKIGEKPVVIGGTMKSMELRFLLRKIAEALRA